MAALSLAEINPFVRYLRRLWIHHNDYPAFIVPCDCRLFYVERGEGVMYYRDVTVPLAHGMLLIWQSGMPYHMQSADDSEPIVFLAVNFDLTREFSEQRIPIPPRPEKSFSPSMLLASPECPELLPDARALILSEAYFAEATLREMLYEYERHMLFSEEYVSSMLRGLLALSARRAQNATDDLRIQPILDYLHLHYQEMLSNKSLGERFGFHPNTLSRLVLQYTGQTLHQYLLSYRLQKAVALIEDGVLPLNQICEAVGIPDPGYFSKLFRKRLGCAPSEFMHRA